MARSKCFGTGLGSYCRNCLFENAFNAGSAREQHEMCQGFVACATCVNMTSQKEPVSNVLCKWL